MPPTRQNPARAFGTAVLVLVCASWSGCAPEEVASYRTYYLVDHLPSSDHIEPSDRDLQVPWIEIGFERERALPQHPPSSFRFDGVPSGEGASLLVAPALRPKAWAAGSDGAGFRARCRNTDGLWIDLFDTVVSASTQQPDGWSWHEISLASCGPSTTTLELITTCGPAGKCGWDWAMWGDPKILYKKEPEFKFRSLTLLISIDTLRPDRMSLYGADRPTTPRLDEMATDAVTFETVVAPSPWTIPSHASLLTSTDPEIHGATSRSAIRPVARLLSQILQEKGWTTAGFVDTPWLGKFGFDRGYHHYDAEKPPPGSSRRGVEVTRERLIEWLEEAQGDVFVFWHIMDVHGPYGSPSPFGGQFRSGIKISADDRMAELKNLSYHDYLQLGRFRSLEDLAASYDEGIAHVDAEIGGLLDLFRQANVYEDALIAVTSDHGESLMDHGVWVGHGLFLTEDEIRVPLLIKLPGNQYAGTSVQSMVRLIDVAPTLLDVLGITPMPPTFEGKSLVSPSPGSPRALPRVAFGVSSNTGAHYVRLNNRKLITAWGIPRDQVISTHLRPKEPSPLVQRVESEGRLFDLGSDPEEENNLIRTQDGKKVAEDLRALLRRRLAWLQDFQRNPSPKSLDNTLELTPEEVNRLRALGYLKGGGN